MRVYGLFVRNLLVLVAEVTGIKAQFSSILKFESQQKTSIKGREIISISYYYYYYCSVISEMHSAMPQNTREKSPTLIQRSR